jgi:glutamate/tyrosine decarboxylase-like PLP-dependent enzyme
LDVGWAVEEHGLFGAPEITVAVSEEAHATIRVSLQMLGLGRDRIVRVPSDAQGRMRGDELAATLARRAGPSVVCAQAGNVNTGAFDPLEEIAAVAHAAGAWLHVDGAFGLWAAAAPGRRGLLAGCAEADSWTTDSHKWLNVPYDSGIVFVRDREAHRAAMSLGAAYYVQTETARDGFEYVPESSRRARGFTVWAALRQLGRSGLAESVERSCGLASRFAEGLAAEPGVHVLNEVVLNQVLVRFEADGSDAPGRPDAPGGSDTLTRDVIDRVQREGTCWLGGTTWHGMAAMRISVSGWSTTEEDVDRSVDAILRCAREARAAAG